MPEIIIASLILNLLLGITFFYQPGIPFFPIILFISFGETIIDFYYLNFPQTLMPIITLQLLWGYFMTEQHHRLCKALTENNQLRQTSVKQLTLYEEIKALALSDGLTNIANRRSFDLILKTALHRAATFSRPLCLIILDLDDFKQFNDNFGHLQGDKLLAAVGATLRNTVMADYLPARYGGEEFSIILPNCPLPAAEEFAELVRQKIAAIMLPDLPAKHHPQITASFGIAVYDPQILLTQPDSEKIIAVADKSLYRAKSLGKNRVISANIFQ